MLSIGNAGGKVELVWDIIVGNDYMKYSTV